MVADIYDVTEALMVPDPSLSIRDRAIASWPPAWHGQNLRDILVTLGYDVDIPWKELSEEERHWIVLTEDTPTVPVYPGSARKTHVSQSGKKSTLRVMGTFTGARRYVLHTFAHTQSALMRKRVSSFMEGCVLSATERLKPESLSVTFAGVDIGGFMQMPLDQLAELLLPISWGDFKHASCRADTDRDITRRDRTERAGSGRAVHSVTPDVCGPQHYRQRNDRLLND
ncbi:hypothetical protein [Enterobacter cloacae complex sp. 301C7]|uniref:hypothetical protein n=1 Tax=Enterobacter cloacae complex sp. 301C7 TaxID=3395848 RepID=UPI003CEB3CBB